MRWLVPRLLEVEREQPDLQIALTTTTDHNVNFKTESYDAAIVFGTHMSAGDLLFEEALTPVISPVRAGAALGSLTFLHPTRDKTDWSLWLTKQEGPGFAMHKNQHFDTMDLAITAAIQGLGVAIADETLVAEDVRAGRLMRPYETSIKTGASLSHWCCAKRLVRKMGWRRFAPVCLIEADVVLHHPFEEAHPGAHKAVFKPETCMFIHANA